MRVPKRLWTASSLGAPDTQFPIDDRGELVWVIGIVVKRDRKRRALILSQELCVSDVIKHWSHLMEHSRSYNRLLWMTKLSYHPRCAQFLAAPSTNVCCPSTTWPSSERSFGCQMFHISTLLLRHLSMPVLSPIPVKNTSLRGSVCSSMFVIVRGLFDWMRQSRPAALFRSTLIRIGVSSSHLLGHCSSLAVALSLGFPRFNFIKRSVSFSSAESEIFGAILAAKEGIYLRELLHDLFLPPDGPTRIFSDSNSCIDRSFDPV